MKIKLLIISTVAAVSSLPVMSEHPVNQQMVDEIKAKTNKWQPMDPSMNPLSQVKHDDLHMMLGTRIVPPLKTLMPPSENADIPK